MEPDDEISPVKFSEEHPELHHYTDFAGLNGIIESNTLWATHFLHLNDSTEVTLLKRPLTDLLVSRALEANSDMARNTSRQTRRALLSGRNLHGVRCVTTAFVNSLFGAAFDAQSIEALAEPYITSFCAHTGKQSYERQNGLLSQWRAYGGDESQRYCIVFDTLGIRKLLEQEWASYYWTYMYLDEVFYDGPSVKVNDLFPDLLKYSEEAIVRVIQGGGIDISREAIVALLAGAPWFKHQGFSEEQEARIVAIPGKKDMADRIALENASASLGPLKTIYGAEQDTATRPHIALFDGLKANLPIKRVIVGPSRHQKENLARARAVVGGGLLLHPSETPFIG